MKKGNIVKINLLNCSSFISADDDYNYDISFDVKVNSGLCKVLNITEEDLQRKIELFKNLAEMFCYQLKQDMSLEFPGDDSLKIAMMTLYKDFMLKDQEQKEQRKIAEAKLAIKYYEKILKKYSEVCEEER